MGMCSRLQLALRGRALFILYAAVAWSVGMVDADTAEISFEILPPQMEGGAPTSAVVGEFLEAIKGTHRPELDDLTVLRDMGRSVTEMDMIPDLDHAAVEIVAESKIRAQSGGDIEVASGGGLVGRFVEPLDMVAGGLSFQSLGPMAAVGADADLAAAGDVTAVASGSAQMAAESFAGRVSGDIDAAAGGSVLLTAGGDAVMEAGGSGTASFAGELAASGASIALEAADSMSATAGSVSVQGQDLVSVGSSGATVELSGADNFEYVSHVWRSTAAFDSYVNRFETPFTHVAELVIRAVDASASTPHVRSTGSGTVRLEIETETTGGERNWLIVWSSTYGRGQYSMDGLTVQFAECTVHAIRLSSDAHNTAVFDGWSEVLLHFGRVESTGKMTIQTAGSLDAVAGETISISTNDMALSAAGTLDVSAGDDLNILASTARVQTTHRMDISSSAVAIDAFDAIDVFSNGALTMSANSIEARIQSDASLTAAGALDLVAEEASLDVSQALSVAANDASVRVAEDISAHAGGSVSLATSDASLQADGSVQVFAGTSAELTTNDLSLDALGQLSVRTQQADINAIHGVKLSAASVDMVSADNMDLGAQSLTARVTDSMNLGAGGELKVHSGEDLSLTALGDLNAHVAEAVEMSAGSVSMRSEDGASLSAGGDVEAMVDGNLSAYTSGTVDAVMDGLTATVSTDLAASVGGSASLWAAEQLSLKGAAGASMLMAGSLSATASSLNVASAAALDAVAKSVSVTGSDHVKVGTTGTSVELASEPSFKYVTFQWQSSDSFDEYAMDIPLVSGATELFLRSKPAGKALIMGGTNSVEAAVSIATVNASGAVSWTPVWSSGFATGVTSLDGLHIEFGAAYDVVGIMVTGSVAKSPTFVGWADILFRFGIPVAAGSVTVQTTGTLEALASESVAVGSAGDISVSAGEDMTLSSDSLDMLTKSATLQTIGELSATVGSLKLDSYEGMDLYSQGSVEASVESLSAQVTGDTTVTAGGALEATANAASLQVSDDLRMTSSTADVHVDQTATVYAGDRASLSTHDVEVNAGGLMNIFAGEMAKLVAGNGGVSIDSAGDVGVKTADHSLEMLSGGRAQLLSKQQVKLDSRSLSATAGTVRIDGTATNAATARLKVGLDCGDNCSALSDDAIRADLTTLLGISPDRIVVRGATAPQDAESSSEEDTGRRRSLMSKTNDDRGRGSEKRGQRSRDLGAVKHARDVFARRDGLMTGSGATNDGIRRRTQANMPAASSDIKAKKKAILTAVMAYFKEQPDDRKAQQKQVVRQILNPMIESSIVDAWDLYAVESGHESQMGEFLEAVMAL